MPYSTFTVVMTIKQSVERGTDWVVWKRHLVIPFAPTKGVGLVVGGYQFNTSGSSDLSWNDKEGVFELKENIINLEWPKREWFTHNRFEEVRTP